MSVVLTARDLTRHYEVSRGLFKGSALVRALNGVSFELEAGKTLAVVGESGCGKSTLARALTLIEEPSSGSLKIAGQEVTGATKAERKQLRKDVQMVFQSPYASLNPRQKIGDQLAEPLLINTNLSAAERREKVQAMMKQVGLRPEHYQRYPHMFSGGQRQRIALARAMMLQPKVLVADEPTSALDVSTQAQVLNLFMDLQQEFNTAYVFISHNLSVVRHVADTVLVMYLGRPAEMGPKEEIYNRPLHPYTQALLSATPTIHPDPLKPKIKIVGELPNPLNPPSGCAFHKRCPYATERCTTEEPALRVVDKRQVACHYAEQFVAASTLTDAFASKVDRYPVAPTGFAFTTGICIRPKRLLERGLPAKTSVQSAKISKPEPLNSRASLAPTGVLCSNLHLRPPTKPVGAELLANG